MALMRPDDEFEIDFTLVDEDFRCDPNSYVHSCSVRWRMICSAAIRLTTKLCHQDSRPDRIRRKMAESSKKSEKMNDRRRGGGNNNFTDEYDSSEERKLRKARRPDRQIYRPPRIRTEAAGSGGDGGGGSTNSLHRDSTSTTMMDEDSSEKYDQLSTIANADRDGGNQNYRKSEKSRPDHRQQEESQKKEASTSGGRLQKSISDVGHVDGDFGSGGVGFEVYHNDGRRGSGQLYRDDYNRDSRRGARGGVGAAARQFVRSGGMHRQNSGNSTEEGFSRQSSYNNLNQDTMPPRYRDRGGGGGGGRGRGGGGQQQQRNYGSSKEKSQEPTTIVANRDAAVKEGQSTSSSKEFYSSKNKHMKVSQEEWQNQFKQIVQSPESTRESNSKESSTKGAKKKEISKRNSVESDNVASSSQVPPVSSTQADQPKPSVPSAIPSMEIIAQAPISLSWGDEMLAEDARQAAERQAALNSGASITSPSAERANDQNIIFPANRRGIIQLPAEVANDVYRQNDRRGRGSRRGGAGRGGSTNSGFNLPPPPRHQPQQQQHGHPAGRGGRYSEQQDGFGQRRQYGDNAAVSQQNRSHGGGRGGRNGLPQPLLSLVVAPPAPLPPPQFADREPNGDQHLPARLAFELNELETEVMQLATIITSGQAQKRDIKQLLDYRKQLQDAFLVAIFVDIQSEGQKTLDHRMWKGAFYQPVEALRSMLQSKTDGPDYDHALGVLMPLIEEGIRFYTDLLRRHEKKFEFKLDDRLYSIDEKLVKILPPPVADSNRSVKYSVACCQRYYVCMGDLARYREQVGKTTNYGVARSFYNKAAQLAPTNGRAHNQLALLAMYTNRFLDAVFYYVRSLAAHHAFITAKESMATLFDDIRVKVDFYESTRLRELDRLKKEHISNDDQKSERRLNKRELWKFRSGETSDMTTDERQELNEIALMTKVSAQVLHKQTIAYLLRAVGILFTKIGVECFEDTAANGFIQLRALLALEESPLLPAHLVQLAVVALFLIHHTGGGETESGVIRAIQNHAILFAFSLFGLLLERLQPLLANGDVLDSFSSDTHLLLPAIRVFSMWMSIEENYKAFSDLASNTGGLDTERFSISLWNNLANVCSTIEKFKDDGRLKIVESQPKGKSSETILKAVLPEDLYITSFCNVFARKLESRILSKEIEPELAAEHCRLNCLLDMAYVLDGYECESLQFVDGKFIAAERSESPGPGRVRAAASDEEDNNDRRHSSMGDQEITDGMSQLQLLQKDHEMKQSALERENKYRTEIVVEPSHLIVDTNTFIDHRALVEKIVLSKQYKLAVPFVVYNELLGLAKNDDSWVSQRAKDSARMLQEFKKGTQSSSYSKYVEAYTSNGTMLDLEYHSNEAAAAVSNDDLILNCCRNLIAGKDGGGGAKQEIRNLRYEAITIHRTVVLVTDDKNVRLKAKGDEIPVIGIRKFVKMARLR